MLHEVDGRKIRKLRMAQGLSRIDVAKQLNVPKATVGAYELTTALLSKEQLFDVCLLFNVKPRDLICDAGSQRQATREAIEQALIGSAVVLSGRTVNPQKTKKKKKKKKRVAKSISQNLIISSGFESNRRRH